jgi:uncharacterized protein (TIGR02145 family)
MTKKSFNLRNVVAAAICLAVSLVMFSSCDPQDNPNNPPTDVAESISLNKTTLTIAIGETATLTAATVPANAAVTWTSSNAIAVVDVNGKVTGKAEGTVTITAKAGDKIATCEVTVRGALINGVVWALRNVDEVGTFAATHESYGKFYQWGRKVAWNTTDLHATGWNGDYPEAAEGTEWAKVHDPSPIGWRVPTFAQVQKLLDQSKVDMNWTTQNGVKGFKFIDKANDASIFLPAIGYREGNGDLITESIGTSGEYWSSTMGDNNFAKAFSFNEIAVQAEEYGFGNYGKSVRPVLE